MSDILNKKEEVFRKKTGFYETHGANTLRMYGFSPFHLKPIQAGIQYDHAVNELRNSYDLESIKQWTRNDKTTVICSVSQSTDDVTESYYRECIDNNVDYTTMVSSLTRVKLFCDKHGITYATFFEPQLNYLETSVCFLLDERVWDRVKYPDLYWENHSDQDLGDRIMECRNFIFSHPLFS